MNKICNKCKQDKSIEEFGKSNDSKDGYKHDCKMCRNKANVEYRKTHIVRNYTPAIGS